MVTMHRIVPCLWLDDQAEEAARFYVGIFDDSRIVAITRYGEAAEVGLPASTPQPMRHGPGFEGRQRVVRAPGGR